MSASDLVALLEKLAELASPAREQRFAGKIETDFAAATIEKCFGTGREIGADFEKRFDGATTIGIVRRNGNRAAASPTESGRGETAAFAGNHF